MYQLIDLGKADFFVDFQSFMSANKVASKSQNCPLWYMYCLNSTLALVCRLMRKSMNLNMTGQFLLYFSYALKRNNLYFDHNLHTYYIQILLLYRHYCRRLVWEFWKTKDQSGCGMGDQRTKYYPGKVEKILEGSLDLIPSPSPSMGGKVCLRFKENISGCCQ